MTVSISRMNIEYYLSTTAKGDGKLSEVRDLTSYYVDSGSPAGRWFGAGLSGVSMESGQVVEKRHARRLFEELLDPITGQALGRRPIKTQVTPTGATTPKGKLARNKREAVAGFDLTFSVPKSVSVLWAIADPATQGRLYAAHQAAIDQTLAWLEQNVIQARSGHGGVAHVDVNGLIGTAFDHWDSRAGDPQLHTHAVIANRVQRKEDGQWVTLDSYTLHRHVVAASQMYNGLLFDEVQRRTGAVAEQRGGEIRVAIPDAEAGPAANYLAESEDPGSRFRVELAGVPDELIHEFSSRSVVVEEATDGLVTEFSESFGRTPTADEIIKLRQQAVLATRDAKKPVSVPLQEQMVAWRIRAGDEGFDIKQIVANALAGDAVVVDAEMFPSSAINEISGYVLREVAAARPSFSRANIIAAANRLLLTVRCHTPEARHALVERITDTAVESAVQLSPKRLGIPVETESNLVRNGHSIFDQPEAWLYSTQTLLDQEELMRAAATKVAGPRLIEEEATRKHLAQVEVGDGHHLAPDQAAAAHEVLTSDKQVTAIIGPAGTGKTTTMRGIHAAWTQQFGAGSVVGLAPSAVAASVLSEEVGMATDNLAKWLHESVGPGAETRTAKYQRFQDQLRTLERRLAADPKNPSIARSISSLHTRLSSLLAEQSKYTLRQDQLLIIDEASMAATGDLATITAQVQAAGAKLLLVGDPAQLEAVEAGGFLGWMERSNNSSMLSSVWRFKNDWESEASLKLRAGDPEVIDAYREHGRITDCEAGGANDSAYKEWLKTTTADDPKDTILIGADNESVLDLNTRAQTDLISLGRVHPGGRAAKLRSNHAHVGDVILARKNDRRILDDAGVFIKNGSRITITGIQPDGSAIGTRSDSGERIVLPAEYLAKSAELGYAVTAHRSQGVTVDYAYCAVKEGLGRELLYVGMTRGKHLNQLFVEPPEEIEAHAPDVWDMYAIERRQTTNDVLQGILANATAVQLASEDQDAAHGAANDISRIVAEYQHLQTAISTRELTEWVSDSFGDPMLQELQRFEQWRTLVKHWNPGQPPSGEIKPYAQSIIAAIAHGPAVEPTLFESILVKAQPKTPEEIRVASHLEALLSKRLDVVTPKIAGEPELPAWAAQLERTFEVHKPSDPQRILRAASLWREIADQQDSDYPAGQPDENHRRLSAEWKRLEGLLGYARASNTPEWDEELLDLISDTPPDPGEADSKQWEVSPGSQSTDMWTPETADWAPSATSGGATAFNTWEADEESWFANDPMMISEDPASYAKPETSPEFQARTR